MLKFNMFKFVVIQGPFERKRRRENKIFEEITEKFKPYIKHSNIISGNIYFKRNCSDKALKAFDFCYGADADKDGFINIENTDSLDYTWSLGSGNTLHIDNVDPWLAKK